MAISALNALAATSTSTTTSSSSSTSTSTSTSTTATDSAAATLDYNNFLTLLVAQMENQDPTDPMDATEQMAQLASFSQVEQQIKTNTHLENVITQNSLSTAASYIGKTIESADGTTSGEVESIAITSDGVVATLKSGDEVTIEEGITILNTTSSSSDGTSTSTTSSSTTSSTDSSGDDSASSSDSVDNSSTSGSDGT